jgi:hypothetical protein
MDKFWKTLFEAMVWFAIALVAVAIAFQRPNSFQEFIDAYPVFGSR